MPTLITPLWGCDPRCLSATGKRYAAAAKVLGVTTSQLVRFVEQDRNVARALSELPQ